ncbi:MAG: hypothetical protein ACM3NQ_05260, partial [Bacteroidales bacterium]
AGPLAETDHVLGHELVHAFQFDMVKRLEKQGASARAALSLPLWFIEGMAEYLSVGPVDAQTAMWLRDAVAGDRLPAIAALDDPRYFPYRWGHAFWAYVGEQYGDGVVAPLLGGAMAAGDVGKALEAVLKVKGDDLSRSWHQHVKARFAPSPAKPAPSTLRALLAESKSRLNIGPAISPDGKQVVFFSERDGTAVDLFVASVEDGKVRRKLTEVAVDPHTDSFRFVNSAGAWSADSRKLAFGSVAKGRAQLTIMDVGTGRVEREIALNDVGEVLTASWSPDGAQIVLSAISGGLVDLFIVRPADGSISRLTSDAYSELHPAWSPDGTAIAYVTDRFTSDLRGLTFGELRLARLDLATRASEMLRAFDSGKHINPQWSADGGSLSFVAEPDGVPNIYRLTIADGRVERLTAVPTGVSGISATSPAMSLAVRTGTLVASVFDAGGYRLHLVESAAVAEVAATGEPQTAESAVLWTPSVQRKLRQGEVPDAATFRVRDYKARLSPEGVTPLQAGVGLGEMGPFMTGGMAVTFGDLVGHHNLTLGFNGGTLGGGRRLLDNLSVVAGYQNQRGLWTWGVAGGQTSAASSGAFSGVGLFQGEPVLLDREVTTWEIARDATTVVSRALSRARRLEFAGGYQNLSFRAESRTTGTSLLTGVQLAEERTDLPTPASLNMATGHAAFVHDTTVFGGTSPAMGERYRLQVGAVAGSVNYVTLLADYRRYVRLGGPFSVAGRAMHFGRYGGDAEDPRLQQLFVGYTHLVRGFDTNQYPYADCPDIAGNPCRAGQQLFGSRMVVGNFEFRTSISGYKGLLPSLMLPIEAAWFVDAGVPWSSKRVRDLLDRPTRVAASTGLSIRVNLFGSAVGQVTYVRSNDRANNWRWLFSLTPGF